MGGIFKTKTVSTTAEKLSDFQINSASYGESVPVIFGTTRISGNIIDWFDFTAIPHTTTTRTGKGGGSKSKSTDFTYTVACLLGLAEGPIGGIGRIWKDKEIYDSLAAVNMTVFKGEYGQAPWSYTQGKHPEKALPYSGLAYAAGVVDLGNSNSLPTLNFEIKGMLLDTGDGVDANPADAIQYISSDTINGINIGDTIDAAGLDRVRTYAKATDLLISLPPDNNKKAYEIINDFCSALDTSVFLSEDKVKFVPLCMESITGNGATYTPNTTVLFDLTDDDFLPMDDGMLVRFERVPDGEAYNQYTIEFLNRANAYESETVDEQVLVDVNKRGLRPADSLTMHFLHARARASYVARTKALNSLTRRNRYTVRLDWSYSLLEPGDLLTLTNSALGLDKQPVIVDEWEEVDEEEIEVTAFGIPRGNYSAGIYDAHEAERPFIDFNISPGDISQPVIFPLPSELTTNGLETGIAVSGGENWGGCDIWVSESGEAYQDIGNVNGPARHGILTEDIAAGEAIDTINQLKVKLIGGDQLGSGTKQDAESLNTLCWVDGELIAYQTATLTGTKEYTLKYLVRGAYDTPISAHGAGSRFVRLDAAIFKYPYTKDQIGKTVFMKFASFNVYGSATQGLDDVEAYPYMLSDVYIPDVTNLQIVQHLREVRDGTNIYELEVSWTPPATPAYDHADVYMKTSQPNWDEIETTIDQLDSTTIEDMSNANIWKYIGKANDSIIIPGCATGQTFTVKVVTVTTHDLKANFETAPTISHTIEIKSYIPQMPQNLSVIFTDVCTWSWDENTDTDNDFYELRLDTNVGSKTNLLAKTNSNKIIVQPPTRQGTVYLYAHSRSDRYSPAATLDYNKPAPAAPSNITIVPIFQGLVITCAALPNYGVGINVYINDGTGEKVYFSPNNSYIFKATAGIFDVQIAFVDIFGEGALSPVQQAVIDPTVDPKWIANESLSIEKMDAIIKDAVEKAQQSVNTKDFEAAIAERVSYTDFNEQVNTLMQADTDNAAAIQQTSEDITNTVAKLNAAPDDTGQFPAISQLKQQADNISSTVASNKTDQDGTNQSLQSQITQAAGQITSIVTEMNKPLDQSTYTSIVQALNAINLRVTSVTFDAAMQPNQLITQINLANGTITLDGKLVHITGDTLIDANLIASGMIKAGAITADKINVPSLSAISATIGTLQTATSGARTVIQDNLITVFDANNVLRVRMGVWS